MSFIFIWLQFLDGDGTFNFGLSGQFSGVSQVSPKSENLGILRASISVT